jgi:hypothetical protein
MRLAVLLVAALGIAVLAGCFSQDGTESTSPTTVPVSGQPPGGGPGDQSTGCTGNHSVSAGNGDITSDHACASATTNTSAPTGG